MVSRQRDAIRTGKNVDSCVFELTINVDKLSAVLEAQLKNTESSFKNGYNNLGWGPLDNVHRINLINIIKDNMDVLNVNSIKKDPQMFATLLTALHYTIIEELTKAHIKSEHERLTYRFKLITIIGMIVEFFCGFFFNIRKPIVCNDYFCVFHKK